MMTEACGAEQRGERSERAGRRTATKEHPFELARRRRLILSTTERRFTKELPNHGHHPKEPLKAESGVGFFFMTNAKRTIGAAAHSRRSEQRKERLAGRSPREKTRRPPTRLRRERLARKDDVARDEPLKTDRQPSDRTHEHPRPSGGTMSAQGACDRRQRAAAVECRTALGTSFLRQAFDSRTPEKAWREALNLSPILCKSSGKLRR